MSIEMQRKVETIPLSALTLSAQNMRVGKLIKPSFIESIFTNGLIQPLLVKQSDEGYEVAAGRRRYYSLIKLASDQRIDKHYPVPCLVTQSDDVLLRLSLAENMHRDDPHASEIFTAIRKLELDGQSKNDICDSLQIDSKRYDQIIRLSTVHSKIYKAFAYGKLSEEQIEAFGITANRKRQHEVWAAADYSLSIRPQEIRGALREGKITSTSPIAMYVGMEAYEKAGGTIAIDLFGSVHSFDNEALLNKLAADSLDIAKQQLGETQPEWSWCVVQAPGRVQEDIDIGNQFQAKYRKKSSEQNAHLKAIEKELSAFDDINYFDMDEKQEIQYQEIEDRLYLLKEQIDESNKYFLKREMKCSGVVISIGHDGKLEYTMGLQTKSQVKASKKLAKESTKATAGSQDDDAETLTEPTAEYSQALQSDVSLYRRSIIKSELLKNPDVAADLLNYSCIVSQLRNGYYGSRFHDISVNSTPDETSREDYDASKMNITMQEAYKRLSLDWLDCETEKQRLQGYLALSENDKKSILSYVSALALETDLEHYLEDHMKIDYRQYWNPSHSNYFGRVPLPKLIEHYEEISGCKPTDEILSMTKTNLSRHLCSYFDGDKPNTKWVPPLLQRSTN